MDNFEFWAQYRFTSKLVMIPTVNLFSVKIVKFYRPDISTKFSLMHEIEGIVVSPYEPDYFYRQLKSFWAR